jgi:hypothetical protein
LQAIKRIDVTTPAMKLHLKSLINDIVNGKLLLDEAIDMLE